MRILHLLSASLLLGICAASVRAQAPTAIITANEDGVGTLTISGTPNNMPGVLAADPGPGGLTSALTFNLLGPPSLKAGDLIVLESPGGAIGDIIRFNPAGTTAGYPASFVFYSSAPGSSLADVGFPSSLYPLRDSWTNNCPRYRSVGADLDEPLFQSR
jgi:hypothetical protein